MLRISENGRFFRLGDHTPFFYLADTAWELFHALTIPEARDYFRDRADKYFNVIQAVLISELDGLQTPNAYGQLPFHSRNALKPNEDYFKTVDAMLDSAEEHGLYLALLPTWGSFVNDRHVPNQVVFDPSSARVYGRYLGSRFAKRRIIWILGGDRPADGYEHLWREMAAGIAEGDAGAHLRSYHPQGAHSSAEWLHQEQWLDFNIIQSGHHARDLNNYEMIEFDRAKTPAKPVIDGEPCYEDHYVNWKRELGLFTAYDARKAAWRAVFAGAAGHTYGAWGIFQFSDPARRPGANLSPLLANFLNDIHKPWREALNLPGAAQMQHLRRFVESRPYFTRIPDQSLLPNPGVGPEHARATRAEDRSWMSFYAPLPRTIELDLRSFASKRFSATYYNPGSGSAAPTDDIVGGDIVTVAPPPGTDEDWAFSIG